MPLNPYPRRRFVSVLLTSPLWPAAWKARAAAPPAAPHAGTSAEAVITKFGAVADGTTLNTKAIQATIDHLAATPRGGTVVVPAGVFVTGALFLKPKVNLHLDSGAVLQCSTDLSNFPPQRTRIEGHFVDSFTPAMINAAGCDNLKITGEGTFDGAGMPVWELFWKKRAEQRNFTNIGIPRARLALIESSKNVLIEGITFKDSQFWNCHLYNCDGVLVHKARFQVPDDYRQAPSTDGIDIDSSRNVTIDGCFFSVTDDCIACKGSRGPHAAEDKASPPVEHIRVRNCTYKRGGGVLTCGSEATIVRDVLVEDCTITGNVRVATLKLRPDTPQHYENITFRNITSEGTAGPLISISPWMQFFDLEGQPPPHSAVHNLNFIGIKGSYSGFGVIKPNPGQTDISDVLFKDIDVQLKQPTLSTAGVTGLKYESVMVNGQPQTAPQPAPPPTAPQSPPA